MLLNDYIAKSDKLTLRVFTLKGNLCGLQLNKALVWGAPGDKSYGWQLSTFDLVEALANAKKKSVVFEPVVWENRISCVYLEDYRIAGGKPWGGGTSITRICIPLSQVFNAIPLLQEAVQERKKLVQLFKSCLAELTQEIDQLFGKNKVSIQTQPEFKRIALGGADCQRS